MVRIYCTIPDEEYRALKQLAEEDLRRKRGAIAIYVARLISYHLQDVKLGKIIITPEQRLGR